MSDEHLHINTIITVKTCIINPRSTMFLTRVLCLIPIGNRVVVLAPEIHNEHG